MKKNFNSANLNAAKKMAKMAEKIANKNGSTETWDTAAVKVTEGNTEKATPYELRPWAGCYITGVSEAGADKIEWRREGTQSSHSSSF